MSQTTFINYAKGAKLNPVTDEFIITHAFAEKNFSKSALSYGTKTKTHYHFTWGKTATILIFELPQLFKSPEFHTFMRYMVAYCMPYMEENNLTETKFYNEYKNNLKKEIQTA